MALALAFIVALISLLLHNGTALADPPIFSGDVETDFTDAAVIVINDPTGQDVPMHSSYPPGTVSGVDMKDLRMYYNEATDTLFVGINTYGIAGDVDGDGDPGGTSALLASFGGRDLANFSDLEGFALLIDVNEDNVFDVVAGVSNNRDIFGFSVNIFTGSPYTPIFHDGWGTALTNHIGSVYANPSALAPDIEFTIRNFSQLPYSGPTDTSLSFGLNLTMGSYADANIGDDQLPNLGTSVSIPMVSIGDFVWNDVNANGIQDPGELGLRGVTVKLYDAANSLVVTKTTNSNGLYSLIAFAGDYHLQFDAPSGYVFADKDQGGNDALDSDADPATGKTITSTFSASETVTKWDVGLYQPARIGNFVWEDRNGDGLQTPGEPGINGVSVELYRDVDNDGIAEPGTHDGAPITATTTITDGGGQAGFYEFALLPPGNYFVRFALTSTVLSGYVVSPLDVGVNDTVDSDANRVTGLTSVTSLSPNENDASWDMGVYQPVTIGDKVWLDTNTDGIENGAEPGLAGIGIKLTRATGTVQNATSSVSGTYAFTELPSDRYTVTVNMATVPFGYALTSANSPTVITPTAGSVISNVDFGFKYESANLNITVSDSPDPVVSGTQLTYTLVISNPGPTDAFQVVVTGTLPSGVTFAAATPTQSSGPSPLIWNLGQLNVGATARITVVTNVGATTMGSIVNTVRVGSSTPDSNSNNNLATASTTVRRPPQANNDSAVTLINTQVPITVTANDTDADGVLVLSSVITTSNPANGSVVVGSNGVITYTPSSGFYGINSFNYKVCDNHALCSTAQVQVTVRVPPILVDDSISTPKNSPVTIDLLANDSDVDGTLVVASVVTTTSPANGVVTIQPTGSARYTPTTSFVGNNYFNYRVCDNDSLCATARVTVTILDYPVANTDMATTLVNTPITVSVAANDTDSDGVIVATTVQTITSASHGWLLVNGDGSIRYTPAGGYYGTDTFTYQVCDNDGLCDTGSVTVDVLSPPVVVADSTSTVIGSPVTVDVLANDSDADGVLVPSSVTTATAPLSGTVSILLSGSIRYTPATGFYGTDSFVYGVCDDDALCGTAAVTVTVLSPPSINNDNVQTPVRTAVAISVTANDFDPDGAIDITSVVTVTKPNNGGVQVDAATGVITYTPNNNFLGADFFTYRACDNDGLCGTARVDLAVYVPPVAADDTVYTQRNVAVAIDVLLNDSDFDGTIVASSVMTTSNPMTGTVAIHPSTGVITYTPNSGFTGTDIFGYQVCDNDGYCDTATVSVVVTILIPPVANNDSIQTPKNRAITFNPLANDTDQDGTIVASSLVTVTAPFRGVLSIAPLTGAITYTPTTGYYGLDAFVYRVCDDDALCDVATATIAVLDPPTVNGDSATLGKNTAVGLSVIANDMDNDGILVSTSVVSVTNPGSGNISIDPLSGVITYTAAAQFVGTDTFSYQVCDNHNLCGSASVTLTVTNSTPAIATSAITTATEDIAYLYTLVVNDIDVGEIITISATTLPAWLAFNQTGTYTATLSGTPGNDEVGTHAVSLRVVDASGAIDNQNFSVSVANVNDAPTFHTTPILTATQDVTYTYTIGASDIDVGDTLAIGAPTLPAWLTMTDNGDGTATLRGMPRNAQVGLHPVIVEVMDLAGAKASQSFTVTVANVNDPPGFVSVPITTTGEDDPYTYAVLAVDVDSNIDSGDLMTITAEVLPGWLGFVDNGNGTATISGTPDNSRVGVYTVQLRAEDRAGLTDTQAFSLTVTNSNDAPFFLSTAPLSVAQDSAYTYTLGADDVDVGDVLSFALLTKPAWLALVDNGNGTGTVAGTPRNEDVGQHPVVIQLSDTPGVTVTQHFTITVLNVNDPPIFTSTALTSATEDTFYSYRVTTQDIDAGDVLTITGALVPAWLTLTVHANGTASLSGTPGNSDVGVHSVSLQVVDSMGAVATQNFSVTVANTNDIPTFTSTPVTTTAQDAPYTYAITALDIDAGDVLTVSATLLPGWLTFVDNGDGTAVLSGTARNGDVGTHLVALRVQDSASASDVQTFTVNVANVNDAPSFLSSPTTTAAEDDLYSYTVAGSDPDVGDSLTITATNLPTFLNFVDNLDGTGVLSGTPDNSHVGSYPITLTLTDQSGVSVQQIFTLIVENTNDAPTLTSSPVLTATEDSSYSYSISGSDDDAGDTLSLLAPVLPGWLTLTDLGGGLGTITGTPLNEDVGLHTVAIRLTDSVGAAVTQTFQIAVANVNDPPLFASSPITGVNENSLYAYSVSIQDPDVGDSLTISATGVPTWLTFTDNGGGSALLTGTPSNSHVGVYTITLGVVDLSGATDSQQFTVEVFNLNDAPIFVSAPPLSIAQDMAYTYTVTATDIDADEELAISADSLPAWLTLTDGGDGTALLTGTPTNSQVGSHGIVLRVVDRVGAAATQSFSVTVTDVNDAPQFSSSPAITVAEDASYTYSITTYDIDSGDTVTLSAPTLPAWLAFTATGNGQGLLLGTARNDDVGQHPIVLHATDSHSLTTTQTFTVTVTNTNDKPFFVSSPPTSVEEDAAYRYDIAAEDVDLGAILRITAIVKPSWLSLADNGDGSAVLSGVPDNVHVGEHGILLRVRDEFGASELQGFVVTVTDVNSPPWFTSTPITTAVTSQAMEYTVTAADEDPNESLSFAGLVLPGWAILTNTGNGRASLAGTPQASNVGDNAVILQVIDKTGAVETQTYTIHVSAPPTATPTATPIPTDAPTATPMPTDAPTATPIPTDTPTATPMPTDAPTTTPTLTDTPTATPMPTDAPTATPIPTDTPTATPIPTDAPTATPTSTDVPTEIPTPTDAPTALPTLTDTPTAAPTHTNTPTATPTHTGTPTATPAPLANMGVQVVKSLIGQETNTVLMNQVLTFLIEVINNSSRSITAVAVYDNYQLSGLAYLGSSIQAPQQSMNGDAGALYWSDITLDLGDIPPGGRVTFTTSFRVIGYGSTVNIASLGQFTDGEGIVYPAPANASSVTVESAVAVPKPIYLPLVGEFVANPTVPPCDLQSGCEIDVVHPKGMAFHGGQNALYVVSRDTNRLVKVQGNTGQVLDTAATGREPWDVVINEQTGRIYVSNFADGSVWVYDANTLQILAKIHTGGNPAIMESFPLLDTVAVAVRGTNGVAFLQGLVLKQILDTGGAGTYGLAANAVNEELIVTNRDTGNAAVLVHQNGEWKSSGTRLTFGERGVPFEAAYNPANGKLYIVYWLPNEEWTLRVLQWKGVARYQEVTNIRVGNGGDLHDPDVGGTGLLVNPLNGHVLNLNTAADSISVIHGTTDQVLVTLETGDDPFTITINPRTGILYVALRRINRLAAFASLSAP
ncbi:MAG: tandem-95 repeat protein [Caldilineaceae bacterium]